VANKMGACVEIRFANNNDKESNGAQSMLRAEYIGNVPKFHKWA